MKRPRALCPRSASASARRYARPSVLVPRQAVAHNNGTIQSGLPGRGAAVSERVKIEIYGQTYHIAGDLKPEYVEQLAEYVDGKMREVARSTGTVDSVRVAVLAALAIADELHALQAQPRRQPGEAARARRAMLEAGGARAATVGLGRDRSPNGNSRSLAPLGMTPTFFDGSSTQKQRRCGRPISACRTRWFLTAGCVLS